MNNILCHIVGMNSIIKDDFSKYIKNMYPNIKIYDLDIISRQIRNTSIIKNINNRMERAKKNKNKLKSTIYKKWKELITKKISNLTKRYKNKKIVFIGYCTYYSNLRVRFKIDTNNKFFLNIGDDLHVRGIIEYNLYKYSKLIINGTFPLKYIDHKFLIKQRNIIKKAYNRMKYKYITQNKLNKWLNTQVKSTAKKIKHPKKTNKIKRQLGSTDVLYIALPEDHDDQIEISDNYRNSKQQVLDFLGLQSRSYVNCYTKPWMAVLASVPDVHRKIKKGYVTKHSNIQPYIEEIKKNTFDDLKESCYLYAVKKRPSMRKIHDHKFKSKETVSITQKTYIPNMYNKLKKNGVLFIKFKR